MARSLKHIPKINEKFGKWTVTSELFKSKVNGRSYVTVQCECSNTRDAKPSELTSGYTTKCILCNSDKNRKVAVDDRYNRFLVTGETKDENGKLLWVCICDCGNFDNVKGACLISGQKKMCEECRLTGRCTVDTLGYYLRNVESKAKIRKIHFALTEAFARKLIEKQNHKCALTNRAIWFAATTPEHQRGGTTASLDRINSDKGYTEDNVQFVHKAANNMKMDLGQEDFISFCHSVAETHPLPNDVQVGEHFHCQKPTLRIHQHTLPESLLSE